MRKMARSISSLTSTLFTRYRDLPLYSLNVAHVLLKRSAHFVVRPVGDGGADDGRFRRRVSDVAKRRYKPSGKMSKRDYLKDFDDFGTWDNRIEKLPILVEESIKKGKPIPSISIDLVGAASMVGRKLQQEDRYTFHELAPGILYFGVFDGHRGSEAADFMKSHLHEHVLFHLERGDKDLENVLRKSFITANNAFARRIMDVNDELKRESGTTGTVALLRNSVQLVVAHVGDSRALLYRKGEVKLLTRDHDPEDRLEQQRVDKEGGTIVWTSLGRPLVGGRLAMTRSLGDMDLKPYGVTATPETLTLPVKHGTDAFLTIVSDGVTFVMSNQEIGNCVATCENAAEAAVALCDQALQYGSDDNVTAMVVPFGSWGKYSRNSLMYSFARNLQGRRH